MKKTMQNNAEIVTYQSQDGIARFDVRLESDTVWITQEQMTELFQRDKSTISRHLRNIFNDGELEEKSVVAFFATTASDGKIYQVAYYNLDAVISVGYRVKSQRGVQFRQWATKVLNSYLRYGYAVSDRFERLEQRMTKAENQIETFVRTALPPREGIFMDGQIYDAYDCVTRLIKSAKKEIVLIDNYVDESTITMMGNKESRVRVDIYTNPMSLTAVVRQAEAKFNSQYGGLTLHEIANVHDRFLILDGQTIYLIGASLKDAGKKLFAFTRMNVELIKELQSKLNQHQNTN